jgi:polysaccharide pyruvyl transferase WcaK-like protein
MYNYRYYRNLVKVYLKQYFNRPDLEKYKNGYSDIGILNPSIATSNMGDFIIYESVSKEIDNLYKRSFVTNYPTQIHTTFHAKKEMSKKDILFVSGTNLLTSNIDKIDQFKLDNGHKLFLKHKVVLFGVGWWQYQDKPNNYTKKMYQKILRKDCMHSVRDSFTLNQLNSIGINNVINTGCPTMWDLDENLCSSIKKVKSNNVITTLTCYSKNEKLDKKLLDILISNYEKVFLWVQGLDDIDYLNSILKSKDSIHLVNPSLNAYDEILKDSNIEYVGTRLHAGIRAISKGKRTQIIAVDNRAFEISKDTNLNVIKREDIDKVTEFINKSYTTKIILPKQNIADWKNQLPKF